jgi:hypothetical protein
MIKQTAPKHPTAVIPGNGNDSLVLSYLTLRKAVGIIGLLLPFVLAFGKFLLQGGGIEPSISCYVHTYVGSVFVGSLCAIGVFLLSTRGYDRRDEIAGRLACVFAVAVVLFPTSPCPDFPHHQKLISSIHWSCAALLFLTLAYFCFALFTLTDPDRSPTQQKLQRNTVYRVCGWVILVSIALIGIVNLVPTMRNSLDSISPEFWLESVAVVAFGAAWLVKGEAILKDRNE